MSINYQSLKVVYHTVNSPLISYTFIMENTENGLICIKRIKRMVLVLFSRGGVGLYQACIPWFISPPTHLQQIPFLYRDLFGISSTTFMNHLHHPKTKVQTLSAGVHIMAQYKCLIYHVHLFNVYVSSTASRVLLSFLENCFQSQTNKTSYYVDSDSTNNL